MSRFYRMMLEIEDFDPEKKEAIIKAAEHEWISFQGCWDEGQNFLTADGEGNLSWQSDSEFAEELAGAIFQANGKPCKVTVRATYLDDLPFEEYSFDEDSKLIYGTLI